MATLTATTASHHRLTIDDVRAMVAADILEECTRVELVEGVLVGMNPIGAAHGDTVATLARHLTLSIAGDLRVRVQDVLAVDDDAYVLPDLAVIEPIPRDELPCTALLVIEVAQTSHARDREKVALRVAEYWIVDLDAEQVTVHRGPSGPISRDLGRSAFYRSIEEHRDGAVAPALDGVPPVPLDVLFGRA